jgi:hypothetical protein
VRILGRQKALLQVAVSSGCYDRSRLADLIEDLADGDDDSALRALAKQLCDKQRAAEAKWTQLTTNDRITRAFAALRRNGIVALENAGYEAQSGLADAWSDVLDEASNFDDPPRGAVFYSGTDLLAAVEGKGLGMTIGVLEEVAVPRGTTIRCRDGAPLDELAREICEALAKQGVTATHSGDRITIAPFRWQRRAFSKPPKLARARARNR